MATIYDGPDEIQVPKWDFSKPVAVYHEAVKKYEDELREFCVKRNPTQECVGEVISFPVADGKACYMVAAVKPVQLIHMEIDDCWHFSMAHRLTKKDVIDKVRQEKALRELFSRKKD